MVTHFLLVLYLVSSFPGTSEQRISGEYVHWDKCETAGKAEVAKYHKVMDEDTRSGLQVTHIWFSPSLAADYRCDAVQIEMK